jgi:hypothetical protein
MIVRVLGAGQYEIADRYRGQLDALDDRLQSAAEKGDADTFAAVRHELLDTVGRLGTPVPDSTLVPSELVLPDQDMSLAQVAAMLADESSIPWAGG